MHVFMYARTYKHAYMHACVRTCAADETTDEARLRIAQEYLRQVSATAKGRRPKKGPSELFPSASEAQGEAEAPDPAFASSEDSDGSRDNEDSDDDDLCEYEEGKEALAAELKKKAEKGKVGLKNKHHQLAI